jgi:hypothetical protein
MSKNVWIVGPNARELFRIQSSRLPDGIHSEIQSYQRLLLAIKDRQNATQTLRLIDYVVTNSDTYGVKIENQGNQLLDRVTYSINSEEVVSTRFVSRFSELVEKERFIDNGLDELRGILRERFPKVEAQANPNAGGPFLESLRRIRVKIDQARTNPSLATPGYLLDLSTQIQGFISAIEDGTLVVDDRR